MAEREDEEPQVWGQLGTGGITEHIKDELAQQARRGDLTLLLFLIPSGLFLIAVGVWWNVFEGHASRLAWGMAGLGVVALGGALKIILGKR